MLDATVIIIPTLDPKFFNAAKDMLGRSVTKVMDSIAHKPGADYVLPLTQFVQERSDLKVTLGVLGVANYGCLFAGDELHLLELTEILTGLSILTTKTKVSEVFALISVGNLIEWKVALKLGTQKHRDRNIQSSFVKLYQQFCDIGLSDAVGLKKIHQNDGTYLLCDQTS